MSKDWTRTIAVAAILIAGGLWVFVNQRGNSTLASVRNAAGSSDARSENLGKTTGVSAPWANKANDSTPLVKFLHANPSSAGKQILNAFRDDKAVVLFVTSPKMNATSSLRSWVQQCGDYVKSLGAVVSIDSQNRQEKPLLQFLKADQLQPPILISIATSGEVRRRLSGNVKQKQVIELFAKVTGACGVKCEKGVCD